TNGNRKIAEMAANLKAFTMTATPLRGPTRYLRPPPHREGEWRQLHAHYLLDIIGRQGMAEHIDGPLYYETMGKSGPVMAFVHPNPMDQSCWIFQMAQMSTWYRCIDVDLPGYGKSPKARAGLTMRDVAQACWEAIDNAYPGERAILVGCSIGSSMLIWVSKQNPPTHAGRSMLGAG